MNNIMILSNNAGQGIHTGSRINKGRSEGAPAIDRWQRPQSSQTEEAGAAPSNACDCIENCLECHRGT